MTDTNQLEHELSIFAKNIRYHVLTTLNHLGFGHYGGSLSIVEVIAVLYGHEMNISVENFDQKDRDHFILSKGHGGPALYAALHLKGFFDHEMLLTLNQNGTKLPSHPDRNLTPGVDMTTGSLGQGISAAAGIAYGKQYLMNSDSYTYCIVGDGELNEGQVWEAVQFAAHNALSHFIVFVDDNKKQLDGTTEEISQTFDIVEKFSAFGWNAKRVDGRNISAILEAIHDMKESNIAKPICIVLDTVKGQGVPYIEQMESNHHIRLDDNSKKILTEYEAKLRQELEAELNADC